MIFCYGLLTLVLLGRIEGVTYSADLFRVVTNPNLPTAYASSAAQTLDATNVKQCSELCVSSGNCEAAVYETSNSRCLLYDTAMINITSAVLSNNLKYLEDVCSGTASQRPHYCQPIPSIPPLYKDCQEVFEDGKRTAGIYELVIDGYGAFNAWCDFDDSNGWTVFQRRQDGSVDFYVYWDDYKNGFGDLEGEYWLGNDNLHELTKTNQKLNIYLEAADGTHRDAYYSQFYINDEADYYRMTLSTSGYSGDAEEQLSYHSGYPFTTRDRDYDPNSGNCAVSYTGAWWYNDCHSVNLNGIYTSNGVSHANAAGVNWCCSWKDHMDSLLKVVMRVTRD